VSRIVAYSHIDQLHDITEHITLARMIDCKADTMESPRKWRMRTTLPDAENALHSEQLSRLVSQQENWHHGHRRRDAPANDDEKRTSPANGDRESGTKIWRPGFMCLAFTFTILLQLRDASCPSRIRSPVSGLSSPTVSSI
jgi:hypothetical protein